MNKLIVTAHPSANGFTHKIANTYKKASLKKGDKVEILDLYRTDLKQDFLIFQDKHNFLDNRERRIIQEKIIRSSELIFIFPLWWWDAPAIMKNFIDSNFTPGFAYKFNKNNIPKGLLNDKMASVFITCDGPAWFYKIMFSPFKKIWILGILKFCGFRVNNFQIFDKMNRRDFSQLQKWLREIYKKASK